MVSQCGCCSGCEGNLSVKWLRSLKLLSLPAQTREETSKYTDLKLDESDAVFAAYAGQVRDYLAAGKMVLQQPGVYEVSGLAWSGNGSIRRVEVSADGGGSWADDVAVGAGPMRAVRFRIPWRWQGQPAVLQSRAIDSAETQPPERRH